MKEVSWLDTFEREDRERLNAVHESPASNAVKSGSDHRRRDLVLQTLAVIVMLALSAALLLMSYTDRMASALGSWYRHEFAAPPFFSLADFNTIQPGMTEGEVRARIGFPLIRSSLPLDRLLWTYTAPTMRDSGNYLSCQLVFEGDPKCVRRVIRETCHSRTSWVYRLQKPLVETLGEVQVSMADGRLIRLTPTDSRCHVLLTEPAEVDELQSMASDRVLVLLLPRAAGGWLSSGDATVSSSMGIYKAGTLYRMPPRVAGWETRADLDDRKWVLRRLLMDKGHCI